MLIESLTLKKTSKLKRKKKPALTTTTTTVFLVSLFEASR